MRQWQSTFRFSAGRNGREKLIGQCFLTSHTQVSWKAICSQRVVGPASPLQELPSTPEFSESNLVQKSIWNCLLPAVNRKQWNIWCEDTIYGKGLWKCWNFRARQGTFIFLQLIFKASILFQDYVQFSCTPGSNCQTHLCTVAFAERLVEFQRKTSDVKDESGGH